MDIRAFFAGLLLCFYSLNPSYAELRVGTLFFDPPFVLSTTQGFDIDLINLICKKMNEQCRLIPMDLHHFYTALDKKKIDIAIGGIAISSIHESKYIFSLPYMLSKGQFLTLKSSTISSVADLKDQTVGVITGENEYGVSSTYLRRTYGTSIDIEEYSDTENLLTALNSGDIAAALMHRSSVVYWVQNGGSQFKALGDVALVGDGIGIMALKGNEALIGRINQLLKAIENDGSYLTLYTTYFANE